MTLSMHQMIRDAKRDMPDHWWRQMIKTVFSGPCGRAMQSNLANVEFCVCSDFMVTALFVSNQDNTNLKYSDDVTEHAHRASLFAAQLPQPLRNAIPEAWTTDRVELRRSLNKMQLQQVLAGILLP